jgi:hypothetical protein
MEKLQKQNDIFKEDEVGRTSSTQEEESWWESQKERDH